MTTETKKRKKGETGTDDSGMIGSAFRFVNGLSGIRAGKNQAAFNLYKLAVKIMRTAQRLQAAAVLNSINTFKETVGAKLASVATVGLEKVVRPATRMAARSGLTLKT